MRFGEAQPLADTRAAVRALPRPGRHSAVLLRQAYDQFCGTRRRRFVHFYLPADNGVPIPLNWLLSDSTARFIWAAFTDRQVWNGIELERLGSALASTVQR